MPMGSHVGRSLDQDCAKEIQEVHPCVRLFLHLMRWPVREGSVCKKGKRGHHAIELASGMLGIVEKVQADR